MTQQIITRFKRGKKKKKWKTDQSCTGLIWVSNGGEREIEIDTSSISRNLILLLPPFCVAVWKKMHAQYVPINIVFLPESSRHLSIHKRRKEKNCRRGGVLEMTSLRFVASLSLWKRQSLFIHFSHPPSGSLHPALSYLSLFSLTHPLPSLFEVTSSFLSFFPSFLLCFSLKFTCSCFIYICCVYKVQLFKL